MAYRRYLDWPTPIAIAHRGGAEECPENTLPAFAAAVDLGYRYLETDVHVTRDGFLVAFHDAVLDRVTNGRGRIADLSLAEVRSADAGHHFSPDGDGSFPFRNRGITVPTLEEILRAWPHVRINIDMKSEATVAPLAELLQHLDILDRVCVGSFSERRLRRFRLLTDARVCTSMGPSSVAVARLASLTGRMPARGADCVQVPVAARGMRIVDAAFVRAAHREGLKVHVWTIDEESVIERLIDLDVDGIMTDRPRLLRNVMLRRGVWPAAEAPVPAPSGSLGGVARGI